jgi:hypothetical protein
MVSRHTCLPWACQQHHFPQAGFALLRSRTLGGTPAGAAIGGRHTWGMPMVGTPRHDPLKSGKDTYRHAAEHLPWRLGSQGSFVHACQHKPQAPTYPVFLQERGQARGFH